MLILITIECKESYLDFNCQPNLQLQINDALVYEE